MTYFITPHLNMSCLSCQGLVKPSGAKSRFQVCKKIFPSKWAIFQYFLILAEDTNCRRQIAKVLKIGEFWPVYRLANSMPLSASLEKMTISIVDRDGSISVIADFHFVQRAKIAGYDPYPPISQKWQRTWLWFFIRFSITLIRDLFALIFNDKINSIAGSSSTDSRNRKDSILGLLVS